VGRGKARRARAAAQPGGQVAPEDDHDGQGDEGEPGELLGALEAERGGDAVVLLLQ